MPRSLSAKKSPPPWIKRLSRGCPAGLLYVVDRLTAHPGQAGEILEREVRHRHDVLALTRQARSFVRWRLCDALQSFVVMSALILSLLWTFHGVARLREWFRGLDPRLVPGGESFYGQLQALVLASPLRAWQWEVPALIVGGLVIGLFARQLAVMLFSWRELRPLRESTDLVERELARLEMWRTFVREQTRRG